MRDLIEYRTLRFERAISKVKTNDYARARKLDSVAIDLFQMGKLNGVVHELIHFVLRKELEVFDTDTEEIIVDALELSCVEWIQESEGRVKSWRALIERSLKDQIK